MENLVFSPFENILKNGFKQQISQSIFLFHSGLMLDID